MKFLRILAISLMISGFSGFLPGPAMADHETPKPPSGPASEETGVAQADPVSPVPPDVVLAPDRAVVGYLMERGYFNPFPDNRFHPEAPITRAEFVTLLYRAAKLNTPYISEFPYFRDVPTDHWAYLPIEGFRMRDVLKGSTGGYFHPQAPMRRMEAGVILSKSLEAGWLSLSDQEVEATLKAYSNDRLDMIPDWARYDLARSIYAGLLLPHHRPVQAPETDPAFVLDLDIPLTRMEAAHMVYRRALVTEEEGLPKKQEAVWLPAGVNLVISPTSAISPNQLNVGYTVYFTVTDSTTVPELNLLVPRGTRLSGKVTEISEDHLSNRIVLERMNLPSGEVIQMASQVTLNFDASDKSQQQYIVPGETFNITTQPKP